MEKFSLEKGNLYDTDNIKEAEKTYKEKRGRVLDNIINEGRLAMDFETRELQRKKLNEKIKEGFMDRGYLENYHWPNEKILISKDIIDFLIPQIEGEGEEKDPVVIKYIGETILPTKDGKGLENGSGNGYEKKIIPRLETLVEMIEKEGVSREDYCCLAGKNKENMLRSESYVMVIIPELEKMVFVCNEEGNATFVIHDAPDMEDLQKIKSGEETEMNERSPEFYYRMTKENLRTLNQAAEIVSVINWSENNWPERIEEELTKDLKNSLTGAEIKEIIEAGDKAGKKIKILKAESSYYEVAPPGWMRINRIPGSKKRIARIANEFRKTHPEWFKVYKEQLSNWKREHLAPELVDIIKKEVEKYETVPQGWLSAGEIANKVDKDWSFVRSRLEEYKKTNPEWFKKCYPKKGGIALYCAPEFADLISAAASKYESAPINWKTRWNLAKKFSVDFSTIGRLFNEYKKTHPEWIKEYVDSVGKVAEFCSPELVKIIEEDIAKREKAPEGWIIKKELCKKLNISHTMLMREIEKYEKNYPDLFKIYADDHNQPRKHYSLRLVELMKENSFDYEKTPGGWDNAYSLSKKIGKQNSTVYKKIKKISERYRQSHPDWFKFYLNDNNNKAEYYAPELIEIIKKEFDKVKN